MGASTRTALPLPRLPRDSGRKGDALRWNPKTRALSGALTNQDTREFLTKFGQAFANWIELILKR